MLNLFTGKGGVGKTRLSLLHYLQFQGAFFSEPSAAEPILRELKLPTPPYEETALEGLMSDLFVRVLKMQSLADWLGKKKLLQNLMRLAPNLEELLILHRWVKLAEKKNVVVDAPSTGTFIGTLRSVKTALEMFDGGAIREMAEEVDQYFGRQNSVQVYVVSIAENSALEEMREIEKAIRELYPHIVIHRILNRIHGRPPVDLQMPEAVRDFSQRRYELEQKRIQGASFSHRFDEGARQWG